MTRQISAERRTAYKVGLGIMIVGGIVFASAGVTFVASLASLGSLEKHFGTYFFLFALQGFGGMLLLIVGSIIRGIGARGLAGSGVVLDPEQAREDLEPFTRMAGGMAKDALDEAGISLGGKQPERVVMVKCQACGRLNQEDAKFCQDCGKKL
jgi:hypothetical protein